LAAPAPKDLAVSGGWSEFARSFLIGGVGGAVTAGVLTILLGTVGLV
jgi:hypothetical protein